MKRTHLVLDERLLEEVTRVSGERSYSRAVTRAIEEYLRHHGPAASSSWRVPDSGKETSPR